MRKIFLAMFLLVFSCLCLIACGEEKVDEEAESEKLSQIISRLHSEEIGDKYINVLPEITNDDELDQMTEAQKELTYVGLGINLIKGCTFFDALSITWLNDSCYGGTDSSGNTLIKSIAADGFDGASTIADNLSEAFESLKITAEIGTGKSVPFFSGNVSAGYGAQKTINNEAKFFNSYIAITTKKQTFQGIDIDSIKQYLRKDVLDLINNKSKKATPEVVINECGSHIITQCTIGGCASISALYDSHTVATNKDISAALDFKSAIVDGKGSMALTDKQKQIIQNTEVRITARGGNGGGTLSGLVQYDQILAGLKNWGATVSDKPTIASIQKLIPIWEFADDQGRADEIKKYFESCSGVRSEELNKYFAKNASTFTNGGVYVIKTARAEHAISAVTADKSRRPTCLKNEDTSRADITQQWVLKESKEHPGYFAIENMANGYVFTENTSIIGKKNLIISPYSGALTQLFKFIENGDGTVRIESLASSRVFAIPSANGDIVTAPVYVDKYNATEYLQKWIFSRIK